MKMKKVKRSTPKGASPEVFASTDLFLTAYLLCEGFSIVEIRREEGARKVTFILSDKPNRAETVNEYLSGTARVEPLQFKAKLSHLKTLIYSPY
jgi:hypothetical protein